MLKPSFLARLRTALRRRNYSYRTEQAYVRWIIRFVKFCGPTYPLDIAPEEITRFLD